MGQLVEVSQALPSVQIDFRYASGRNVAGHPLYPTGSAMLINQLLVEPLRQVGEQLKTQNIHLVLWDAHRDQAIQTILRDICPDEQYVLDVSNHVLDRAVDVTLADISGRLLDMGTDFDDFSSRAHRDTRNLTTEQQQNRQLLDHVMTAAGFVGWPYEWWHFDYLHTTNNTKEQSSAMSSR